jgi:hypothetical protein
MEDRIIGITGLILTIISLGYGFYMTKVFYEGIKIGAIKTIRKLINRMEQEKKKIPEDSPTWPALHHTQQDLEDLSTTIQSLFKIKENLSEPNK